MSDTVCQLVLGCVTWVVNYWWPTWAVEIGMAVRYFTIESKGWLQSLTATAHAATGSLILGLSVYLWVRAQRILNATADPAGPGGAQARGATA